MTLTLPAVTFAAMAAALAMTFFYAPTESLQGEAQRIFYVHVPSAWASYMAIGLGTLASLLVFARRGAWARWDRLAVSSIEVGLVFLTVVLVTGPIWGRPVWGVWWVWDARLTSTLVLWATYAGYLVYRSLTPPGERRARLAGIVGIVGAVNIPVVHFSVVWWNTLHPGPTVIRPEGPDLPGEMLLTLMASLAAFTLLFACLVRARNRIEASRARLDRMLEAVGA